jgi:hypothetical protein
MIECIAKPTPLDNDVAVMKILQLMGQLSINDIQYLLQLTNNVYGKIAPYDIDPKGTVLVVEGHGSFTYEPGMEDCGK